jgi:hypothetical protein
VTGGCERILRTPVPLSYSRHNSRFLIIWLTLLPFTLWDQVGAWPAMQGLNCLLGGWAGAWLTRVVVQVALLQERLLSVSYRSHCHGD